MKSKSAAKKKNMLLSFNFETCRFDAVQVANIDPNYWSARDIFNLMGMIMHIHATIPHSLEYLREHKGGHILSVKNIKVNNIYDFWTGQSWTKNVTWPTE